MQSKNWEYLKQDDALRQTLCRELKISETLAGILLHRGLTDPESANAFIHAVDEPFYDPFLLSGMREAVDRIAGAIKMREIVTVYGDYDVDGITSTALLVRALRLLGANAEYYIPERQGEGYGLNLAAMEALHAKGTALVISVDCGISACEEIAAMRGKLDVIVTDHHCPSDTLPEALAIVNPKRAGDAFPDKNIAGVGVTFKLCQALWREMRGEAFESYIELAALGTVADVVPLTGENRRIAAKGIRAFDDTSIAGLRALVKQAGLTGKPIDAGRIGFVLAPRLNAAGRVDSASTGVELLLTEDEAEAARLAERLETENERRQLLEKEILDNARQQLERTDVAAQKAIVTAGAGWHPGVIGIVASRLVDLYYKPTVVIGIEGGMGKGSCRSIAGFDIFAALQECEDLLEQFGGHAQAAGLSVLPENIDALRARLGAIAGRTLRDEDYIPKLRIDAVARLDEVDETLVEELARLEPYGMGNPRPVFACADVRLSDARTVGKDGDHLKFKAVGGSRAVDGVAWRMGARAEELRASDSLDIAFQPEMNEWQGRRSVQLKAMDFRAHTKELSELDRLYLVGKETSAFGNIGSAEQFYTKIVGVTFEGRQERIESLHSGEALQLVRDPENRYDAQAISVCTADGEDLGYLRSEIAASIAPLIDAGEPYRVRMEAVTGGAERSYGVNIAVYKARAELAAASRADAAAPVEIRIGFEEIRTAVIGGQSYHAAQERALRCLEEGKNTFVIMGTGRGKSAIFQTHAALLAARREAMTIIVYPLRALVNDQERSLRHKMEPLGISVFNGNGTLAAEERQMLFEALEQGAADILLTTPEFLQANLDSMKLGRRVGFLVIDECHHIAEGGRRPAYRALGELVKRLGDPLVLGVTATADDMTTDQVRRTLGIAETVIDPTVRENLEIRDARGERDRAAYLERLVKTGEKMLVFVNSRNKAVDLAAALRESCPKFADKIGFYHAGLANEWRVKVESWFREGALQVVVATSAFGEGVDLPDIRHVAQYHLPFDPVSFNQQCGRAGRDGQKSLIHLLFGNDDIKLNRMILSERAPERDTIGKIYLTLKAFSKENGNAAIEKTNAALAESCSQRYRMYVGEGCVGAALRILEQLGLLDRETYGSVRRISLNEAPKQKLDLGQSAAFVEGTSEREAFAEFAELAIRMSADEILTRVNRPIYPELQGGVE